MSDQGFAGSGDLEFNWHPLLMTISLVYLYGNGILVYRYGMVEWIQYGMVWYGMVWYGMVWYGMANGL